MHAFGVSYEMNFLIIGIIFYNIGTHFSFVL